MSVIKGLQKSLTGVVTEVTDDGIVKAIVSVFGNVDDGNDIIHAGSFAKTIIERFGNIRVLDGHRTSSTRDVIGKPLVIKEIGVDDLPIELRQKYPSATGGLYTETQYFLDTPEGEGVFKRIKAGGLKEYSIGFDAIKHDFSKTAGADGKSITVRNIREIKLWEYSPVIWGMNSATMTVGVKEYTPEGPQKRIGEMLAARVHYAIISPATDYLSMGYFSVEEYLQLNTVATQLLEVMQTQIPEDMRMRPIQSPSYDWFFFSGDGADETTAVNAVEKAAASIAQATKAGRVLSGRNAARIKAALDELTAVLDDAGVLEIAETDETPETDDQNASKAIAQNEQSAEPGGDSSTAPLTDPDAALAQEIELMAMELGLMEVSLSCQL